ncbi:MAG TPA: FAD-dependent oxidoreductase [Humisphaera sp.]
MNRWTAALTILVAAATLFRPTPARAGDTYDVVVYGGTGSGVIAAVQAGRMGKTVVLIEPSRHLGGVTSGGLTATDMGNRQSIAGVTREFYARVKRHYDDPRAWTLQSAEEYRATQHGKQHLAPDAMFAFEPHVAERIFEQMAAEAKVVVVKGERLDLKAGVTKDGPRIVSIRMESGRTFASKQFVDATYEGDLMAKAGVAYVVGRESRQQYGERAAGVHVYTNRASTKPLDPYVVPGDKTSGVLPNVDLAPIPPEGSADGRTQAYNYRVCLTKVPANRVPFDKPADYDEREFELYLRYCDANAGQWAKELPLNPVGMPNGKTDTNNNGTFSTDNVNLADAYPEADYATREKIVAQHVRYVKGFLWTLANHPRVPQAVRAEAAQWGYAKDEFVDNGHFPQALYVREARRMVGPYVMTEHDVQGRRSCEDPVALGSYFMDCHIVRRYLDAEGYIRHDGGLTAPRGFAPYGISFRSITPKAERCSNLTVTVCLSSSHAAYGSIRMEPVYMMLGQAAGTAGAMAIDAGTPVQAVDYAALKARLLKDGSTLMWPPESFTGVRAKQLPGVVVDNAQADRIGKWTGGGGQAGVDGFYMHDGNENKGKLSAKYTLAVPADGRYEVRVSYIAHPNRATNVPVTVQTADGMVEAKLDERKKPPIDGLWASVGTYRFTAAKGAVVTIANDGTDGYVVIDAVQLLPAK